MSVWLVPGLLVVGLAASAWAGPALVRAAAPTLSRTPRLAVVVLVAAAVVWTFSALAVGPILAWFTSGPALLTGQTADVCQRCLDAANPFGATPAATGVPSALLVAVPAVLAVAFAAVVARQGVRHRRSTRLVADAVRASAVPAVVAGHDVLVSPDPAPMAFSLARRHGGVVVCQGALDALDPVELRAVVAHEMAHLRQRHHLAMALVHVFVRPLRVVPLMAAVADAIPHYLEIAADDAARRRTSSGALASALLKLGTAPEQAFGGIRTATTRPALLANGPDRIGHLIDPVMPTTSSQAAVGLSFTVVVVLALGAGAVHASYLLAALAGCS